MSIRAAQPGAVLFDLDGTLIDSESVYASVGLTMVLSCGGVWSRADQLATVGATLNEFAASLQRAGVDRPLGEIVSTLVQGVTSSIGEGVPWRVGAQELVGSIAAAGVPVALVTMSHRDTVCAVYGDSPPFDVVITGNDVAKGKPDPEPYLLAARRLGVDPASCIAIEDSVIGLTSAGIAGLARIAVPLDTPVGPQHFDAYWETFDARSVQDVVEVWQSCRVISRATY